MGKEEEKKVKELTAKQQITESIKASTNWIFYETQNLNYIFCCINEKKAISLFELNKNDYFELSNFAKVWGETKTNNQEKPK